MAEDELARFERLPALRRPGILAGRLPAADHLSRILAAVPEERAANSVAVPEMLLVPVVDERRRRLIWQEHGTRTAMPGQLRDAGRPDLGEQGNRPRKNLFNLLISTFDEVDRFRVDRHEHVDVLRLVPFLSVPNRIPQ